MAIYVLSCHTICHRIDGGMLPCMPPRGQSSMQNLLVARQEIAYTPPRDDNARGTLSESHGHLQKQCYGKAYSMRTNYTPRSLATQAISGVVRMCRLTCGDVCSGEKRTPGPARPTRTHLLLVVGARAEYRDNPCQGARLNERTGNMFRERPTSRVRFPGNGPVVCASPLGALPMRTRGRSIWHARATSWSTLHDVHKNMVSTSKLLQHFAASPPCRTHKRATRPALIVKTAGLDARTPA